MDLISVGCSSLVKELVRFYFANTALDVPFVGIWPSGTSGGAVGGAACWTLLPEKQDGEGRERKPRKGEGGLSNRIWPRAANLCKFVFVSFQLKSHLTCKILGQCTKFNIARDETLLLTPSCQTELFFLLQCSFFRHESCV